MTLSPIRLDDKYTRASGRVFLTGIQALVRLCLVQQRRDRSAGLETAGFVSGYRGSPLGGLDQQLWAAQEHLDRLGIHFEPGVNEELAMTAVWGSQMVGSFRGARHEGVHALWYGKAPGLDRATDALKHGNAAGSARMGGVLVVVGDDHECKSSTLPSQSELLLRDAGVPVLNPASVQEVLDYGLHGFALSRYAGCWSGMIALADTMDSSATVSADLDRVRISLPAGHSPTATPRSYRPGTPPLEQEQLLRGARLEAALAYARANTLDRVLVEAPDARLGIVTTGKATLDVLQALGDLGLDASERGIRVYKVGMPWPLEPEGLRDFATGLQEILVVEEKRDLIEGQIREHLYALPDADRPRIVGKRDEHGAALLPDTGALSPGSIARAIASRIPPSEHGDDLRARLEALRRGEEALEAAAGVKTRQPFFCSGCPHNVSTVLPEGSRGLAGIGCHYMVQWMDRQTDTYSQMGGEGVQWIGQAPFSDEGHVFANLGDGTYYHSGILAIRAALSAGVNITYKILFNDAVAMTGGQSVDGPLDVPQLTRQLAAEGVVRIAVVSDEPDRYPTRADFAPGVTIHHRRALDTVQRELRGTPGCTVLVYDQTCAAELRRRRKRGLAPEKPGRLFINEAVCEGCGDCSRQSNCISIEPLDTEFGRKRHIDQTSCNKDESCLEGLCPAFVTVRGGSLKRSAAADPFEAGRGVPLPEPRALEEPWNLVITGVGGTGVVTLGALIGMASHLEGRASTVLDMTGLAQKGGAVISHVRIADSPDEIHTTRVPTGKADALLACDLVVAASRDAVVKLDAQRTHSVVNTHLVPTAEFVMDNAVEYEPGSFLSLIHDLSHTTDTIDATDLARRLLGDSVGANVFMLGYAFQRGLLPISFEAIEQAIALNGVAVEANHRAFRWGRLAAHDPAAIAKRISSERSAPRRSRGLEEVIARREEELQRFQGSRLARRYRRLVDEVDEAERCITPGRKQLTEAVARGYAKLLAYKDEYEVARLHTDGAFLERLREEVEGDFVVEPHLAPPLWARTDPDTGRPRKRHYGAWMMRAMAVLARFRFLRGTPLDPFGYTLDRRLERRLIADYEKTVALLLGSLSGENHGLAVHIAGLPDEIRGYGTVKTENVERARALEKTLVDRFLKHQHLPLPDDDGAIEGSPS